MKAWSVPALVAMFLLFSSAASAQSYSIRVTYNTNLRVSYSLSSAVIASAPAGTSLQVVGNMGRWLRINWNGNDLWMADWVAYTRVEGSESTLGQSARNIDNCCFVDRQCHSDQDWTDGYWAFQNNQCPSAAPAQTPVSSAPAGGAPAQIDNCCFAGWQCQSDKDWADGYWAYQNGQCDGTAPAQPQRTPGDAPATVDHIAGIPPASSPEPAPVGEVGRVTRVIDGDTIDVLIDGKNTRIRYLQMNTPERDEPCYREATARNADLVAGKTVTLVSDVELVDRFDRWLRFVYVGDVSVSRALVEEGFAEVVLYPPNRARYDEFARLEAAAAAAGRGCHPTGIFADGSTTR